MSKRRQGLLEVGDRLAVGRTRQGLVRRLAQIRHCLVPELPVEAVMGEALDRVRSAVL